MSISLVYWGGRERRHSIAYIRKKRNYFIEIIWKRFWKKRSFDSWHMEKVGASRVNVKISEHESVELGNGNRAEMLRYWRTLKWCHFSSPSLSSATTRIFVEFDVLGACKKLMFWLLYLRTVAFYRYFVHFGFGMLTRDSCLLCGSEWCAAHYIARLTLTLDLFFFFFKYTLIYS